MVDLGNPFGVDLATMIFGAGLSLLLSASVMSYEDEITGWTAPELLGAIGAAFVAVGTLLGITLVIVGLR